MVPWKRLLHVVPAANFTRQPVASLLSMCRDTSLEALQRTTKLMRQYRADVLWGVENSRAPYNLLRQAIIKLSHESMHEST